MQHKEPITPQVWEALYLKDKAKKALALAQGLSLKEANAIAYSHQIAYQKSSRGIEKRKAWQQSSAGKEAQKKASAKYYAKKRAEKVLKEQAKKEEVK